MLKTLRRIRSRMILPAAALPIVLFKCSGSPVSAGDALTVACREVLEDSLHYSGAVGNPFTDVEAKAVFSGPGGQEPVEIEGFHDGGKTWRFRFAPRTEGRWSAVMRLKHDGRKVAEKELSFICEPGERKGFLRRSEKNPYRLEYEDGSPFYSVGIQPCGQRGAGLDGPPRGEGSWRTLDMDTYLGEFDGAANLFRIQLGAGTRAGCAREIITDSLGLYRYNLDACRLLDETFMLLERHGFSSILIPFQDMSLWQLDSTSFGTNRDTEGWKNIGNREKVEPVLHYLRYLVARYAAYTDIWELFNEDVYTPDAWLEEIASFVQGIDPYGHLLTTNYERPLAAWNDIVTAHLYVSTHAREVEMRLTKEFARLKSFGKPVMYTEFGNKGNLSNRDPVKWRLAVWTAFMNESSMLFWSMGGILLPESPGTMRGGNANAYLGKEARQYFRHHLDFVRELPADMRPAFVGYPGRDGINKYALSNGDKTVLYLHHYTDHRSAASGGIFVWTGAGKFRIEWYEPESGKVVKTEHAETRSNTLIFQSPEVVTDMAALIKRLRP